MATQVPKTVAQLIRADAPASAARTALGLGSVATHDATEFQAADGDLTALAALSGTGFAKRTGSNTWAVGALVSGDVPDLSATYSVVGHAHAASDVTSGTLATARLGSGTANSTTFLRGDQTWATPAGGLSVGGAVSGGGASRVLYEDASQNLAASANLTFNGTSLDVSTNPLKFGSSYSITQADNGWTLANTANDLVDLTFNTSATGANIRYENRSAQLLDAGLPELQLGAVGAPTGTAIKVNRDRVRVAGRIASTVGLTVMGQASQTAPLIALTGLSSTATERRVGAISGTFVVATDASRTGRLTLAAADSTGTDKEGLSVTSNGTTADVVIPIANVRDAADDTAAAALSPTVPVGGIYRTGSILKIRVS